MAKKAKKKVVRREWTKNDVRELKSLAKQKIGVKKIAKAEAHAGCDRRESCEAWRIARYARVTEGKFPTIYWQSLYIEGGGLRSTNLAERLATLTGCSKEKSRPTTPETNGGGCFGPIKFPSSSFPGISRLGQ